MHSFLEFLGQYAATFAGGASVAALVGCWGLGVRLAKLQEKIVGIEGRAGRLEQGLLRLEGHLRDVEQGISQLAVTVAKLEATLAAGAQAARP